MNPGSTEKEDLCREQEDFSREKENLSREKEDLCREQEDLSREKEDLCREQEDPSREKEDHSAGFRIIGLGHDRVPFPNMILIAGDGRNVGKTSFAMQIIRKLSQKADVIGIKTTSHKHVLTEGLEMLVHTGDYMVALEKGEHRKDSAIFRQAGAAEVFVIMAEQQFLRKAFSHISAHIHGKICVAESGGLAEIVHPGIFFFIRNQEGAIRKKHYLEFDPVVVMNRDMTFDFAIEKLDVINNELVIKE